MDNESKTFKVNIFGSEYVLRADKDNDILQIASYVDQKMREIHSIKMSLPLHQVAILTALNIAEELFDQQKKGIGEYQNLKERLQRLIQQLELGIQNPAEWEKQNEK